MLLLIALCIGIIAGLRALTAPTAVSWAAKLGLLPLAGSWLAFLGYRWTPWILTLLALAEIINDKLPATPSRKVPPQFIVRVLMGSVAGAAVTIDTAGGGVGMVVGGVGAVIGTLGGAAVRGKLAKAFGRDLPAALLEDVIAVGGAFLLMRMV